MLSDVGGCCELILEGFKLALLCQYYRHWTGLLYKDGVQYLAEQAACYWLVDVVASYQPEFRRVPFQLWQVEVAADRSAEITMASDSGQPARGAATRAVYRFPASVTHAVLHRWRPAVAVGVLRGMTRSCVREGETGGIFWG